MMVGMSDENLVLDRVPQTVEELDKGMAGLLVLGKETKLAHERVLELGMVKAQARAPWWDQVEVPRKGVGTDGQLGQVWGYEMVGWKVKKLVQRGQE